VAHLVGFVVPWRLLESDETPYKTTLFAGRVDVGDLGIKVVGLLWLATAAAFAVAAWAFWRGQAWAPSFVGTTAAFSLVLSLIAWPDSRIGVLINALILAALLVSRGLA